MTERNGARPRVLSTPAGDVQILGLDVGDSEEWQAGDRRYLPEGSMDLLYPDCDTAIIAAIDSGE